MKLLTDKILQHNRCSYDPDLAIVNITSWAILPARNENVMKAILNEVGPIAVSINAAPKTFQLYSEGVYGKKYIFLFNLLI